MNSIKREYGLDILRVVSMLYVISFYHIDDYIVLTKYKLNKLVLYYPGRALIVNQYQSRNSNEIKNRLQ